MGYGTMSLTFSLSFTRSWSLYPLSLSSSATAVVFYLAIRVYPRLTNESKNRKLCLGAGRARLVLHITTQSAVNNNPGIHGQLGVGWRVALNHARKEIHHMWTLCIIHLTSQLFFTLLSFPTYPRLGSVRRQSNIFYLLKYLE